MVVKIRISDPCVVARGPAYKEVGWGPYQFPHLFPLRDNRRVGARWHTVRDSAADYDKDGGYAVSEDGGISWEAARDPAIAAQCGTALPSGDILRTHAFHQ